MATSAPRRVLGISLKMYFDPSATVTYATALLPLAALAASLSLDLFFCPDFLGVASTSALIRSSTLVLGAQDCCEEEEGAFTGEVSAKHLAKLGVGIVELGHAERRRLYGETDEIVARKARAALRNGITPLICIGESTHGSTSSALSTLAPQISSVLNAIPSEGDIVFAYEPVFAIGAQDPAPPEYILAVVAGIRAVIESVQRIGSVRIVYGGSAGPGTFGKLKEGVDGLFLGRFAHDLGSLERCIREVAAA